MTTETFTANFDGLEWVRTVQHARLSDIKAQGDKASDPPIQKYFSFEWGLEFELLRLNLERGDRVAFEIQVKRKLITRHPIKYERVLIPPPTKLWLVPSEKQE